MTLRRAFPRWLAVWWMVSLLFTQLATAAYACPMTAAPAAQAMHMPMPCEQMRARGVAMDAAQPGLCAQHCQWGHSHPQPSADMPSALDTLPSALPWAQAVFTPQPEAAVVWARSARERGSAPAAGSLLALYQRFHI
ncbi:MAG: hypothetical protein KGJ44_12350 [Betaproteobacteria bacterium]|nr:hypothetical protein [Betaproteobacteria bacterium]